MKNNSEDRPPVLAVDVASGESDLFLIIRGCIKALKSNKRLHLLLTGNRKKISEHLKPGRRYLNRITIEHTEAFISMDEDPARSCIRKPDASVVLAAKAVKEGRAFGFYSPGNTGAAVAASVLHIGLLPGIKRPVIAAPLPSIKGSVLLLDAGACVDAPADFYPGFARLGSIFMQKVYNIPSPKVGLLNMGSEANKGPALMRNAYQELTEHCPSFIGNIEGMEIPVHRADVVVCDGFVGNIVLKLSEGFGSQMVKIVRHRMKRSGSSQRRARKKERRQTEGDIHRRMRRLTDSERYGGAPLLGINGIAVIGHGKAKSEAVFNGIRAASRFHRLGLLDGLRAHFFQKDDKL